MAPPRIAVLILTRGRPGGLVAAVRAFHALASGDVPVQYVICGDDDDETIPQALDLLEGLPVLSSLGPRPDALGEAWNRGAADADAWDLAFLTGDDVVPVTWHWDRVMAAGRPDCRAAFAWRELNDPTNITYPVVARPWFEGLGRIVPEAFPYWFNDSWLAEVHAFAFGRPLPLHPDLAVGGRRGTTREMREVAFWFEFFAATRPQRIAEAARVAAAFGERMPDPAPLAHALLGWDAEQQSRVPLYNVAFGADQVEPTARYRRCKDAALAAMALLSIRRAAA